MTAVIDTKIDIDIAYLVDGTPVVEGHRLPPGSTVADALIALSVKWNARDWLEGRRPVGVFGRIVSQDLVLSDGDRVELYSPLPNDPKTARRQRARAAAKSRR